MKALTKHVFGSKGDSFYVHYENTESISDNTSWACEGKWETVSEILGYR